jgi:uncharacterized protein
MESDRTYTAFAGNRLIFSGELRTMVLQTKKHLDGGDTDPVLIFEDQTGVQIDFDLRGTPDEALARLSSHPRFVTSEATAKAHIGPGRPKLGVVCREVSLLPRHWTWLEQQSGGVSGALRRLVDEARNRGQGKELARLAREAASKFMWVMAGNLPNFEEASRALFAKDQDRLEALIGDWPEDIREHLDRLVQESVRLENAAANADPAPDRPV